MTKHVLGIRYKVNAAGRARNNKAVVTQEVKCSLAFPVRDQELLPSLVRLKRQQLQAAPACL